MTRLALGVGLTRLDPAVYQWNGDCPGCDVDVLQTLTRAHAKGFDGVAGMINALAAALTIGPFSQTAAATLKPGDLALVYFSCHGGLRPDTDGDEVTGYDQTLLLWDGELIDDLIARKIQEIPRGVRLWLITDSCHSETNHRAAPATHWRTPEYHSPLLHWAGCGDLEFSFGSPKGGLFTRTWHDVDAKSRRLLSYGELWDRIAGRMDQGRQIPRMTVEGGFDLSVEAWR